MAARLSHLDPDVEGVIRVVMFYDTLMRRRVDLPALARASAGLAECVTGIRLHSTGRTIRMAPDGREAAPASVPASSTTAVTLDDEEIGTVWLEREGEPGALDDAVLDRLAIAVATVVERYGPARTTMADPALVELVISAGDDAASNRALRLLGFPADAPIRVVAVRSGIPLEKIGSLICQGRPVKAASLTGLGIILATAVDPARFPEDVRAGIGEAGCPHRSWQDARTALRFTTARRPVIHYGDLGALALLARIPEEDARANADVVAITKLAADPEDLRTLDAYCEAGSVRQAADSLHLHHSSVARRLTQIGKSLAIDLTAPLGLTRARLALTAWRLLGE
ncbi:hypothetical protein H074_31932 [Amycolatopsis decaplanina DSM 44594]|uniref:PucR C-terminal helix-turn-helix domain-containing protein n=1 Tax=Amycolatopsis decaplanina DSM 44594 TaxID=1284240 RepID=M2XUY4_9PSEU|nr:hypothetical protein H074_31932 [Amycolatopsis decaplanina DSM 44594]